MENKITPFLTPKQKTFCDEYLTDRNATAAALRAGYSRDTAMNGYLMTLPKIKLYLEQQMEHITQEVQVSHAQVLKELCKIAFGNMGNYFEADGSMKPMDAWSDDDKAGLWSVSVSNTCNNNDGGITKVRMYNKMAALDRIAKHIGFYKPQSVEPKTLYQYVTTAHMTEDDTFDDVKLQQEILDWEANDVEKRLMEDWEARKNKSREPREKNEEGVEERMESEKAKSIEKDMDDLSHEGIGDANGDSAVPTCQDDSADLGEQVTDDVSETDIGAVVRDLPGIPVMAKPSPIVDVPFMGGSRYYEQQRRR